jgi:hypothetical protein
MSKVVAIAASLKAVLLIATGALARGDMLPVILISAIFDLGLQIRSRVGHTEAARNNETAQPEPEDPPRI